jgi:threonine dehydrogenase-like Zn-dependent dehydrogenase
MPAAVFGGPGLLEITSRPTPRVSRADDVLIAIEACGICGSDLQILAVPPAHPAKLGVILGHEISGRVIDQGPDARVDGELVVVDPDIKCGVCRFCRRGRPAICEHMVSMGVDADGGFATHCVVPAGAVYPISSSVNPANAAMVEPLSNVLNGVARLGPQLGESAVVIGGGPIGAMFLMALVASGVDPVWVIEPGDHRRAFALEAGAAGAASSADELAGKIEAGNAPRPEIVIDAVGRCLDDALMLVDRGGRVLLFGINHNANTTVHQSDLTMREITVLGSVTSRFTIPAAIRAIEQKVIDVDRLGIHESSLDSAVETVAQLRNGRYMKAVICPQR